MTKNSFIAKVMSNVHHKEWLTYSGGTVRSGELCYNSQTTLLKWLTFLFGSQTVILTVLLFWIYFLLLQLIFVLQWFALQWEILIMLLSQFPLIFHQILKKMPFYHIAQDYSCADWDGLCDHLKDVPWEDIFKLVASAAASEFCKWVRAVIDVYIPHYKY